MPSPGSYTGAQGRPRTAAPLPMRLSDHVYHRVVGGIMAGEFAEATRLPAELALAQRFGVSRVVVREAIARLREEGLIVSRRGAGNFVGAQPDRAVLRFAPLGSISDIEKCFEFRAPIEAEAAYFAACHHDQETLARIFTALKELGEKTAGREIGALAECGPPPSHE
ncbi:MAG: FadR/GntR family transcriptional regulator [Acetobacteraceae bacterium]